MAWTEGRHDSFLYNKDIPTHTLVAFLSHSPSFLSPVLDPVGSASKLAFFQNVQKAGGVDALELFDTVFKSKAFGVLTFFLFPFFHPLSPTSSP